MKASLITSLACLLVAAHHTTAQADDICSRLVVKNADKANCNGVYKLTSFSTERNPSKQVYKHESKDRYIFWNDLGYGWSIGKADGLESARHWYASELETAEPWQGPWKGGVSVSCEGVPQKRQLLSNLYRHQKTMNSRLQVDPYLERLAQSYSEICPNSKLDHSFHQPTDGKVLNKFGRYYANLALNYNSPGDSEYDQPATQWKNSPGHYKNLMSGNKMGCSVVGYGYRIPTNCMFCYYA